VGEVKAGDRGDLQAAGLDPAVAAVAGVVLDGDLPPGQGSELLVQGGMVGLDEQQVGGVLDGDQPLGVLTVGVRASAVTTRPARSKPSSSGRNWVISLVV
jgi:hypothetical protein